jgi:phosphate transport system protein
MADRCETMMRGALDAFASRDPLAAQKIIGEDDAIDEAYRQLFASVLLMGGRDAAEMERSNYILWIAHDLERTADRCTNICERTIYLVTGALVADQKSAMEIRLTAMAEGVGDNPDRAATT